MSSTGSNSTGSKSSAGEIETLNNEKDMKEILDFVKTSYSSCKNARQSTERQWYLNLQMYLGNQWVQYGKGNMDGKLVVPKAPRWRTRVTVNRIRPVIRTELSRITSQKPTASVVPASSEDKDLFAAQAGSQVWESFYNRKKVFTLFKNVTFWTLISGNGFMKTYWDQSAVNTDDNLKGDVQVEKVTPFHIFVPDLTEEDIEDQPYVIHAKTVTLGKAKLEFPEFADRLKPNVVSASEIMDNSVLRVGKETVPDSVLCLEMWMKPGAHDKFPNGGMVRVMSDYVVEVHKDGIPYTHGQYPFTHFGHIPTGKFYFDSVIVDIRNLQREFNRTRSQIIEAKNRMAKPQLRAAEGSIDPAKITSEPGQVIFYKPGFDRPEPMPLQGIPSYVMQELDRIIMDIEDLTAQHQVSKGSAPPGVTAATAISYLQERDDSVLSHTNTNVEAGMEKIARQVLSLVVQFWTTERVVKVTGTDDSFSAVTLKGSDLQSGTDLRMEAGSALPTSKAARQSFLMDLMKMGFIPPEKGLELMEIGGVNKLYEQLKVDERQAQRENLRMQLVDQNTLLTYNQATSFYKQAQGNMMQQAQMQQSIVPPELAGIINQPTNNPGNMALVGGPPALDPSMVDQATGQPLEPPAIVPVNTWDNHAIHIDVHNRFRKGQTFEQLSDEHKALFEQHVSTHEKAMQAKMAEQAMMGGGPPPVGGPPSGPPGGAPMPPMG